MKKDKFLKMCSQLAIPGLVTLLGLVLLLSPDSATAMASKLIGWVLVVGGAVKAISMADKRGVSSPMGWIYAFFGIILGVLILSRPLILAESLGRFIGLLLAVKGISDLRNSAYRNARILGLVTLAIGVGLFLMPMSLTRTLLRLCGLVAVVIGIVNIVEKLTERKHLNSGEKPKIIDADE